MGLRIYKRHCLQAGKPPRQRPEPSGTSGKPGERGATGRASPPRARGWAKSAQKRPRSPQPPRAPRLRLDPHRLEEHFSSNLGRNTPQKKKNGAGGTPLTSQPPSPKTAGLRAPFPSLPTCLQPGWEGAWEPLTLPRRVLGRGGPGHPFPWRKIIFAHFFFSQQTRWRAVLLRPTSASCR